MNQGGNGNPTATIGHEPERTTVHGVQGALAKQLSATPVAAIRRRRRTSSGSTSDSFNVNPVGGAVTPRRPRVPDNARFTQGGVFAQTTIDVEPDRVAARRARCATAARAIPRRPRTAPLVNGQPLWPDDSLSTSQRDVPRRRGRDAVRAMERAGIGEPGLPRAAHDRPRHARADRLGLRSAAPDVAGLGGFVGTTADATAVSTGDAVTQVGPETSAAVRRRGTLPPSALPRGAVALRQQRDDNIQKQALILPPGAVGTSLGGTPITAQNANGVVFVAATTVPVLVRANFDNARIWGIEHSAEARIVDTVTLTTAFTYLRAKDKGTGLSPNIEGGTPAPDAWFFVRWMRPDGRVWVEPYLHVAWEQTHLSSLDLGDRRTGAGRTRASIRAFFLNGARARNWISPGADNAFGTADDLLTTTGETLAQIQDRVLGVGVNSSSLFPTIPGYATFGVRASFRAGRHQVTIDAENLGDENYRGISWGLDAPGRGISVKYVTRF